MEQVTINQLAEALVLEEQLNKKRFEYILLRMTYELNQHRIKVQGEYLLHYNPEEAAKRVLAFAGEVDALEQKLTQQLVELLQASRQA